MSSLGQPRGVWIPALLGAVLLAAAHPPWNLSLVAWVAPLPWLHLIRQANLPGRRPYGVFLAAGFAHWLVVMQGVRLAHWLLHFGWLALAFYLAAYVVGFVALTRVAVHRLRIPLWLAAPTIWTGLELLRSNFLSGFAMALLGHTQARWPSLIQIADVTGAYGVSFVVMLVAAALASCLPVSWSAPLSERRWTWRPLVAGIVALVITVGYGSWKNSTPSRPSKRTLKIALLQQSFDTIFEHNPERSAAMFAAYRSQSLEVARAHPDLDVIVWPESMFSANAPELTFDEAQLPPEVLDRARALALGFENKVRSVSGAINSPSANDGNTSARSIFLLVGCDSVHYAGPTPQVRNSALLIDPAGKIVGRYAKQHLVMFGEYIPLADIFPWLYKITPMPMGVTPGDGPRMLAVKGAKLSSSVCFESTVPHLIRRQMAQLRHADQTPDLLVNVTNDGWFWGSAILDLHLQCAIFRAVENRRSLVVAANTGITAAIDSSGRVTHELPRRTAGSIVVSVSLDDALSWYQRGGDWFAAACLLFCGVVMLVGVAANREQWMTETKSEKLP